MKKIKKIVISCVALILLGVALYFTHYYIYYIRYDEYKASLVTYEREVGKEFSAISEELSSVPHMVLVAEVKDYKLYTNLETTEIAIFDKRNNTTIYSNPVDADSDSSAIGVNKSLLKSQIILDYYNEARTSGTMNNYDMSTQFGQFAYEGIEDGIRYIYTFGDLSSPTGIVPEYITPERLQIYLDLMEEKDARSVKGKYIKSKDNPDILELTSASKKKSTLAKMNQQFEKAGYTAEDYNADMALATGEAEEIITFTVEVEYKLDEKGLLVTVPTDRIVETGGAKVYNIQLLRYMGAANSTDKGYMVVPNGSGSIINFNNGKTTAPSYFEYVYGMDPLLSDFNSVENTEYSRLPYFGMNKIENGFVAYIESGDTLASISADVAGKVNGYNYIYPSFVVRQAERLNMFGVSGQGSDLPVVEKEIHKLDLSVRYSILTAEQSDYSGMANHIREHMLHTDMIAKKDKEESIPFYMGVIGGVQKTEHILGVPYLKVYKATTFQQAKEIASFAMEQGIENIRMNYQGWFNGGYYHDVGDKIKEVNKLGGKKELEELTSYMEDNGGKVFVDVAFQQVPYSTSRYRYEVESSKYYGGGYPVSLGKVNPISLRNTSSLGYLENMYNLISPKFLVRYVDKFSEKIIDYNVSGVSLRDLGSELHSDKKRTNVINREEAKYIVIDQIEKMDEATENILISGGNYYALPYTKDIINVPLRQNDFFIVDEEIPFYQMVLHGSVDYTGVPINQSDSLDEDELLLRMVEYGASPYFTFTYEQPTNFKYSAMNVLYATYYKDWMGMASEVYKELNEVLKAVSNSFMIKHENLGNGVKKISYDNGVNIYINSSNEDKSVDGVLVSAKSYMVEGGKQ